MSWLLKVLLFPIAWMLPSRKAEKFWILCTPSGKDKTKFEKMQGGERMPPELITEALMTKLRSGKQRPTMIQLNTWAGKFHFGSEADCDCFLEICEAVVSEQKVSEEQTTPPAAPIPRTQDDDDEDRIKAMPTAKPMDEDAFLRLFGVADDKTKTIVFKIEISDEGGKRRAAIVEAQHDGERYAEEQDFTNVEEGETSLAFKLVFQNREDAERMLKALRTGLNAKK